MNKKGFSLLMPFLLMSLSGCEPKIQRYDIKSIKYEGGSGMSYGPTIYYLDFENNTFTYTLKNYSKNEYQVYDVRTFTEEQEASFIDGINEAGLLDIEDHYVTDEVIDDGYGWSLNINFYDDTSISSGGYCAEPDRLFDKCTPYFIDLCGVNFLHGTLKKAVERPSTRVVAYYYNDYNDYDVDFYLTTEEVSYNFNGVSKEQTENLFEINSRHCQNHLLLNENYKFVLYPFASSYPAPTYEKVVIKSYDFVNPLSNEEVVFNADVFDKAELILEMNKIYTIEYKYSNGDFILSTFNTYTADEYVKVGSYFGYYYEFVIDKNEACKMSVFKEFGSTDMTFLNGRYELKTIEDKLMLVANMEKNLKLTFEVYGEILVLVKAENGRDLLKVGDENSLMYEFQYSVNPIDN